MSQSTIRAIRVTLEQLLKGVDIPANAEILRTDMVMKGTLPAYRSYDIIYREWAQE